MHSEQSSCYLLQWHLETAAVELLLQPWALYLVPVYQVGREALQDKARENDTSCGHSWSAIDFFVFM